MLWSAFTAVVGDAKIADGPLLFMGVLWNAGSAGQGVQLFADVEGRDVSKFADLEAGTNLTGQWFPPHPVYCERGLYITFDGNTDDAVVFWRPLPNFVEHTFGERS